MSNIYGNESKVGDGLAIFLIIVIAYILASIYILYAKQINLIISDILQLLDYQQLDNFHQIVYYFLTTIPVFTICISSMFISKSSLGISVIVGSDMFNIGIVFSAVLINILKNKRCDTEELTKVDPYLFTRDSSLYLVLLIALILINYYEKFNWWVSLLLIIYFFFCLIMYNSASLKSYLNDIFEFDNEDDSFIGEEQLTSKKKRNSITQLVKDRFLKTKDPIVQANIKNHINSLIEKYKKVHPDEQNYFENAKGQHIIRWHKCVYLIMFALRKQITSEKLKRSQYYAKLWNEQINIPKDQISELEEEEQISAHGQEEEDKDQGQLIKKSNQDLTDKSHESKRDSEKSVANTNKELILGKKLNINEQNEDNYENFQNNQPILSSEIRSTRNRDYLKNKLKNQQLGSNEEKSISEIVKPQTEISLKFPQGIQARLQYIFFFPSYLIIAILPNYQKNPSIKKLLLSLLLYIALVFGSVLLIDYISYKVAVNFDTHIDTLGVSLISIGFQSTFLSFNYKIQRQENGHVEELSNFFEIGIFKGSFIYGLSFLLQCIVKTQSSTDIAHSDGAYIVLIIFTSLIFLIIMIVLVRGFVVNKKLQIIQTIFYIGFLISSIVIYHYTS